MVKITVQYFRVKKCIVDDVEFNNEVAWSNEKTHNFKGKVNFKPVRMRVAWKLFGILPQKASWWLPVKCLIPISKEEYTNHKLADMF